MRLASLLLLTLLLNGCASVIMTFGPPEPRVYAGTRFDAGVAGAGGLCESGNCPFATEVMPFVIDLPFSFALDTLFLPYTIPSAVINSLASKYEPVTDHGQIEKTK